MRCTIMATPVQLIPKKTRNSFNRRAKLRWQSEVLSDSNKSSGSSTVRRRNVTGKKVKSAWNVMAKNNIKEFPLQVRSQTYIVETDSEEEISKDCIPFPNISTCPQSATPGNYLDIAISSPTMLPFVKKRLTTTPRSKTAGSNPTEKCKRHLPNLDSTTANTKKEETRRDLTKMSLSQLQRERLLKSPYLKCLKELIESPGKTKTPRMYSPSTPRTAEFHKSQLCQQCSSKGSIETLPRVENIVVTRSSASIMSKRDEANLQRNRGIPSFVSKSNNSANNAPETSIRSRTKPMSAIYKQIETEKMMENYKNFKSQTNIILESDPPSGSKNMAEVSETRNSKARNSKGLKNGMAETKKVKELSTAKKQRLVKKGEIPKQKKRQGSKVDKMRALSQQNDRSKYWTKEVQNYQQWNTFCVLRKYRNDSTKLKEQIRLLMKTDKFDIGELWREAETTHDYIQVKQAKLAESLELSDTTSTSSSTKTENLSETTNSADLKSKPKYSIQENLVPAPKFSHLEFLIPHLRRGSRKCILDFSSNKLSLSLENKNAVNNGKTTLHTPWYHRDESASRQTAGLEKSDVLEIVTSYIPEATPSYKLRARGERLSFLHLTRGTRNII